MVYLSNYFQFSSECTVLSAHSSVFERPTARVVAGAAERAATEGPCMHAAPAIAWPLYPSGVASLDVPGYYSPESVKHRPEGRVLYNVTCA